MNDFVRKVAERVEVEMNSQDELKIEGILSKGYGLSPKLVMRDKRLTVEAKAIYAYMASFAGNGFTAFPSVSLILSDLVISKDRFYKHRKLLIELGYIEVKQENQKNSNFKKTVYTLKHVIDSRIPCFKDTENKDTENRDTENKEHNSNSINSNSINNNSINKYVALQDISLHKKIIEYLNKKTDKKYRHESKGNQRIINGRLSEGYEFDDFKKVIDVKVHEWTGTKMEQYLRPSTLFNSEKFEAYLNQDTRIKKEKEEDSSVKYDYGF